ncbi:hypothetical protein GYB62_00470 [bacterium]|nr:hypothetical protein [bacterium]
MAETSLGLSGEDVLTTGELSTGDSIARDGVDVVKRTRYDLFYRYDGECRFCDSGVSVFYNKQDFNVLLQDESAYGINPRLSYRSSPHVTWVLDSFVSETRFPNEATLRKDRLNETTLTMEYQPERRWTFELSAASIRRDSNIVGLDYDDIVGSFTIRYDLFGSESSVSAISSGI